VPARQQQRPSLQATPEGRSTAPRATSHARPSPRPKCPQGRGRSQPNPAVPPVRSAMPTTSAPLAREAPPAQADAVPSPPPPPEHGIESNCAASTQAPPRTGLTLTCPSRSASVPSDGSLVGCSTAQPWHPRPRGRPHQQRASALGTRRTLSRRGGRGSRTQLGPDGPADAIALPATPANIAIDRPIPPCHIGRVPRRAAARIAHQRMETPMDDGSGSPRFTLHRAARRRGGRALRS
jgi:hypothetical protein